jgi:hypothetical protein
MEEEVETALLLSPLSFCSPLPLSPSQPSSLISSPLIPAAMPPELAAPATLPQRPLLLLLATMLQELEVPATPPKTVPSPPTASVLPARLCQHLHQEEIYWY